MELIKACDGDFEIIYAAMTESFVPEEIRDKDKALAVLKEKDYTAYKIIDTSAWVGFITVWELAEAAFIEHFVIFPEFRGRGFGGEVLTLMKKKYRAMVLEVEPPTDEIKKRRISFYKRCGFFVNDYYYLQPSYRKGGEGVELILMSYPALLESCDAAKRELYSRVYKEDV